MVLDIPATLMLPDHITVLMTTVMVAAATMVVVPTTVVVPTILGVQGTITTDPTEIGPSTNRVLAKKNPGTFVPGFFFNVGIKEAVDDGQRRRLTNSAKAHGAGEFADHAGRLVRASCTFPGLPLLRVSRDVIRARITKAPIACQNHAPVIAVFERAILAVPMRITRAQ